MVLGFLLCYWGGGRLVLVKFLNGPKHLYSLFGRRRLAAGCHCAHFMVRILDHSGNAAALIAVRCSQLAAICTLIGRDFWLSEAPSVVGEVAITVYLSFIPALVAFVPHAQGTASQPAANRHHLAQTTALRDEYIMTPVTSAMYATLVSVATLQIFFCFYG